MKIRVTFEIDRPDLNERNSAEDGLAAGREYRLLGPDELRYFDDEAAPQPPAPRLVRVECTVTEWRTVLEAK